MILDRFAPSPTGLLHLGHAFSAWTGWFAARAAGGRYLLRMEDLDSSRVRPDYYTAIERDLSWLGLDWDGPVLWQSSRLHAYTQALDRLGALGLAYVCTCTRRDIVDAISAPQAQQHGPDGPIYPGTCRSMDHPKAPGTALRLDIRRAVEVLGGARSVELLSFRETGDADERMHLSADHLIDMIGDVVLRRRDGAPAYHLAVVVDDAFQGVTRITRGADLLSATPIHRLLQALLGLTTPEYHHHRLILDETGKRLAKRDDARSLASLRDMGATPADILAMVGVQSAR